MILADPKMRSGNAATPWRERFWAKVEKTETCWLWTGRIANTGYGQMRIAGQVLGAHRVSYALHLGPIGAGLCVCHRCDVRHCVNPAHLFLGTNAENQHDKHRKGRAARGSRQGSAKLTDAQYASILPRRAAGETLRSIAEDYGVSTQSIWRYEQRWGAL